MRQWGGDPAPIGTVGADRDGMGGLRREVGNLIRHHREMAGLTQAELAGRVERSVQLIGRMERGQAAPGFETLEAMSTALNVPVRDFFGAGTYEVGRDATDPLVKLIDRLSGLDPTDLVWIDRLVSHALSRRPPRRAGKD